MPGFNCAAFGDVFTKAAHLGLTQNVMSSMIYGSELKGTSSVPTCKGGDVYESHI